MTEQEHKYRAYELRMEKIRAEELAKRRAQKKANHGTLATESSLKKPKKRHTVPSNPPPASAAALASSAPPDKKEPAAAAAASSAEAASSAAASAAAAAPSDPSSSEASAAPQSKPDVKEKEKEKQPMVEKEEEESEAESDIEDLKIKDISGSLEAKEYKSKADVPLPLTDRIRLWSKAMKPTGYKIGNWAGQILYHATGPLVTALVTNAAVSSGFSSAKAMALGSAFTSVGSAVKSLIFGSAKYKYGESEYNKEPKPMLRENLVLVGMELVSAVSSAATIAAYQNLLDAMASTAWSGAMTPILAASALAICARVTKGAKTYIQFNYSSSPLTKLTTAAAARKLALEREALGNANDAAQAVEVAKRGFTGGFSDAWFRNTITELESEQQDVRELSTIFTETDAKRGTQLNRNAWKQTKVRMGKEVFPLLDLAACINYAKPEMVPDDVDVGGELGYPNDEAIGRLESLAEEMDTALRFNWTRTAKSGIGFLIDRLSDFFSVWMTHNLVELVMPSLPENVGGIAGMAFTYTGYPAIQGMLSFLTSSADSMFKEWSVYKKIRDNYFKLLTNALHDKKRKQDFKLMYEELEHKIGSSIVKEKLSLAYTVHVVRDVEKRAKRSWKWVFANALNDVVKHGAKAYTVQRVRGKPEPREEVQTPAKPPKVMPKVIPKRAPEPLSSPDAKKEEPQIAQLGRGVRNSMHLSTVFDHETADVIARHVSADLVATNMTAAQKVCESTLQRLSEATDVEREWSICMADAMDTMTKVAMESEQHVRNFEKLAETMCYNVEANRSVVTNGTDSDLSAYVPDGAIDGERIPVRMKTPKEHPTMVAETIAQVDNPTLGAAFIESAVGSATDNQPFISVPTPELAHDLPPAPTSDQTMSDSIYSWLTGSGHKDKGTASAAKPASEQPASTATKPKPETTEVEVQTVVNKVKESMGGDVDALKKFREEHKKLMKETRDCLHKWSDDLHKNKTYVGAEELSDRTIKSGWYIGMSYGPALLGFGVTTLGMLLSTYVYLKSSPKQNIDFNEYQKALSILPKYKKRESETSDNENGEYEDSEYGHELLDSAAETVRNYERKQKEIEKNKSPGKQALARSLSALLTPVMFGLVYSYFNTTLVTPAAEVARLGGTERYVTTKDYLARAELVNDYGWEQGKILVGEALHVMAGYVLDTKVGEHATMALEAVETIPAWTLGLIKLSTNNRNFYSDIQESLSSPTIDFRGVIEGASMENTTGIDRLSALTSSGSVFVEDTKAAVVMFALNEALWQFQNMERAGSKATPSFLPQRFFGYLKSMNVMISDHINLTRAFELEKQSYDRIASALGGGDMMLVRDKAGRVVLDTTTFKSMIKKDSLLYWIMNPPSKPEEVQLALRAQFMEIVRNLTKVSF